MNPLSVAIITYNEQANIRDCLESVKWAQEIVVVDSFSTDETAAICREYTDKVFFNPWPGYWAQWRLVVDKTSHQWVLVLAADERLTPGLIDSIQEALTHPEPYDGFALYFHHYFLGKMIRHCGWNPDYKLRLFRKDKVVLPETEVHEAFTLPSARLRILERGHVDHYSYRSLAQYLEKFNRYTSLEASNYKRRKAPLTRSDFLRCPVEKFTDMYFRQEGFKDGLYGLILCVLSSLYVFVSYAKLWELHEFSELGE